MTARAALVASLIVLGCAGAARSDANLASSAVEVWASGCASIPLHGSGAALGHDLVATVAHVVAGAKSITVDDGHGHSYQSDVVAIDTLRDAAVLRVEGLDRPAIRLRVLSNGERGSFFGFGGEHPGLSWFTVVHAAGLLSEDIYRNGEHLRPGYQLQATVVAGDSGAGLIAGDGTLGGLVWAASKSDDNRAWAIGAGVVSDLVDAIPANRVVSVPCT